MGNIQTTQLDMALLLFLLNAPMRPGTLLTHIQDRIGVFLDEGLLEENPDSHRLELTQEGKHVIDTAAENMQDESGEIIIRFSRIPTELLPLLQELATSGGKTFSIHVHRD